MEWVTPGHPLFEVVRDEVLTLVQHDLSRGAVFFDLHSRKPYRLDVFSASISDGRSNVLTRRLFVVQADLDGQLSIKQPTIFLDLSPAPSPVAAVPEGSALPDRQQTELALLELGLNPLLEETRKERNRETAIISRHIELSLNTIIHRENMLLAQMISLQEGGSAESGLEGRIKISEDKLLELDHRLQTRRRELEQERQCAVGDIKHLGRAWVLPHPDRHNPRIARMVADPEIERIAVQAVIAHEEAEGRVVESVEADNRGFDLISRKPHPEDPKTAIDVRFIEVKGRAYTGDIAVTGNEYKTAQRLGNDYWLYIVSDCARPDHKIDILRNPATLDWEPVVRVEHYLLRIDSHRHPAQ